MRRRFFTLEDYNEKNFKKWQKKGFPKGIKIDLSRLVKLEPSENEWIEHEVEWKDATKFTVSTFWRGQTKRRGNFAGLRIAFWFFRVRSKDYEPTGPKWRRAKVINIGLPQVEDFWLCLKYLMSITEDTAQQYYGYYLGELQWGKKVKYSLRFFVDWKAGQWYHQIQLFRLCDPTRKHKERSWQRTQHMAWWKIKDPVLGQRIRETVLRTKKARDKTLTKINAERFIGGEESGVLKSSS